MHLVSVWLACFQFTRALHKYALCSDFSFPYSRFFPHFFFCIFLSLSRPLSCSLFYPSTRWIQTKSRETELEIWRVKVSFTFRLLVCCCLFRMLFLLKNKPRRHLHHAQRFLVHWCKLLQKQKLFSLFLLILFLLPNACMFWSHMWIKCMCTHTSFFHFCSLVCFVCYVLCVCVCLCFGTRGHIFSAELWIVSSFLVSV